MNYRRVLVAGASGFVGRAITRTLSETRAIEAVAGVRDTVSISDLDVNTVTLDITRPDDLEHIFSKFQPEIIINAAAYGVRPNQQDSQCAVAVNTNGALNLLETATAVGCQRFVQLSTCSEYGAREGRVSEDMLPIPTSLYGATKAAATLLLLERGASLGIDTLVLRLFNLWGEDEPAHRLFPDIIRACQSRHSLELTDGNQLKDYSYVGDIAKWIATLALKPDRLDAGIVNIASGNHRPLRGFILEIAKILECNDLLHFGAKENRIDEARTQVPDLSKLEVLLPGRKVTPFEIALERVVTYMNKPNL